MCKSRTDWGFLASCCLLYFWPCQDGNNGGNWQQVEQVANPRLHRKKMDMKYGSTFIGGLLCIGRPTVQKAENRERSL